MKTLYGITGDIKDINTLLVQRKDYEAQSQDAKRYRFIRDMAVKKTRYGSGFNFEVRGIVHDPDQLDRELDKEIAYEERKARQGEKQ